MRLSVSYIPCYKYSKKKTGDRIMFAKVEEGYLLSEACEDAESGDKSGDESDEDSIMPPLLRLEETGVLDSDDESDYEHMSTEMLEDIRDGSQSHT